MRFSDNFLETLKNSIPIEDVIGEYVRLTRKGQNYVGLCPFHSEKTPSFSVSPTKQIFHCFGCGVGGNVFTFLQKISNLTFPESVEMLAQKAHINLPTDTKTYSKEDTLKLNIFKVNEKTAYIYHYYLNNTSNPGQLYLQSRNINQETIDKFNLGYAPNEWDKLYKNLLNNNFSTKIMTQAGLIRKSKNDNYIDAFRYRLMIPIFDISNHVMGFGGRTLSTDSKIPKYINSQETPVYHKSQLLFGLNLSKNFIREFDEAIIFEGYFDVIMAFQSNIKNVVAPLGTAFTAEQIKLLGRYSKNVIIVFDPDTAGEKATWRGIELLLQADFKISILRLPFQLDPFDYINKYGEQAFKKLKKSAPDVFTYMVNFLKTKFNLGTIYGKIKLLSYIFKYVKVIQNNVEKELVFSLLSDELKVPQESIKLEFQKYTKDKKQFTNIEKSITTPLSPTKSKLMTKREIEFLYLLILTEQNKETIFANLQPDDFSDPLTAQIYSHLVSLYNKNQSFSNYMNSTSQEIQSALSRVAMSPPFDNLKKNDDNTLQLLRDYYIKLIILKKNKLIQYLRKKIAEMEINQDVEKIQEVQEDLSKEIQERNNLKNALKRY